MKSKPYIRPFAWAEYSRKLSHHIDNPRSVGFFTESDAKACALRKVEEESGEIERGNLIRFYWMIDPSDGVIVDAKYQLFGESILIGLAEALCILIVGKNYDQAARVDIAVVDHFLRDQNEVPAFPSDSLNHLSLVLEAIKKCATSCLDIPISITYQAPPIQGNEIEGDGFPGFKNLKLSEKISLINQVLDKEVRPYVEMDAGGVEVIGLQENQLTIAYQGNCTSCFSATGATLTYIQKVIRAKVDPDLEVIPNL
jgi:NifU-like protein